MHAKIRIQSSRRDTGRRGRDHAPSWFAPILLWALLSAALGCAPPLPSTAPGSASSGEAATDSQSESADSGLGRIDAPMPADASNVHNESGLLEFDTALTVAEARQFYEQGLPDKSWSASPPGQDLQDIGISPEQYKEYLDARKNAAANAPQPDEDLVMLNHAGMKLLVILSREGDVTHVLIYPPQIIP